MDDEKLNMKLEERMHKDLMEQKLTEQEYKDLIELEKITRSDPKLSKLSEERENLEKEMIKIGKKTKFLTFLYSILVLIIIVKVVLEIIRILNHA